MNNLTNKLLTAMDIIVDQKLANSNRDITVEAEVQLKESTGKYTVKYNATVYDGVSANGSYLSGDMVLMLVPQGDFSKEKTILSKIGQSESDEARAFMTIEDQYNFIGGNLITVLSNNLAWTYNEKTKEYICILWNRPNSTSQNINLMKNNRTDVVEYIFDDYVSLYRKLKVSAKFAVGATSSKDTDIDESNDINYGIRFTFENNKVYEMNIDDMAGNPYSLNSQIQTKLFEFEKNVGQIQKIELFKTGGVTSFSISDFTIYGAIDPAKEGKSVWIQTPDGTTLSEDKTELSFKAIVRHNGEIVEDTSNLTFNWYVADKGAAGGWRQLFNKDDNENLVSLQEFTLSNDDIWLRNSIIVCKVIDGLEDYSNEVEVINLNRPEKWFEIESVEDGNGNYTLSIVKTTIDLPSSLIYKWTAVDPADRRWPIIFGTFNQYEVGTATITVDSTRFAGAYVVYTCEIRKKINQDDEVGIYLDQANEIISKEVVSLEGIYTYYTAQKADVAIDELPGWGNKDFNPENYIKITAPVEGDILNDYWWSEAEHTGFSEDLPRLWTFEKVVYSGKDPQITMPAMIAVWTPNVYRMDLTNDGGTIVTNNDGDASNNSYWDDANTETTVQLFKGDKQYSVAEATSEGWSLEVESETLRFTQDNDTWTIDVQGFSDNNATTEEDEDDRTVDSGFLSIKLINAEKNLVLEKQFSVKKIKNGKDGDSGDSATSYWITANPSVIYKGADGNYLVNFKTLEFRGMLQTGTSSPRLFTNEDNFRLRYCFNNDKQWTTDDTSTNIEYSNDNTLRFDLQGLMDDETDSIIPYAISCLMELKISATEWIEVDQETVLVSDQVKSIKDSYKIYTLHTDKSSAPFLPNRDEITHVFTDEYIEDTDIELKDGKHPFYITAKEDENQRWYKDYIPPITNTHPYQWACDYTEFTDGTAYLSQPERINPDDATVTKELKTIYCGHPVVTDANGVPKELDIDKLPWPVPSKIITNNISTWQTADLIYTWTWYSNNSEVIFNEGVTQKYIYQTSQLVFNGQISQNGWADVKLYSVNDNTDVGEWNLYLQATKEGTGDEGLYEIVDDNGTKRVVMNASLIKTGVLSVTKKDDEGKDKAILYANLNEGESEVTIAGWQVTENSLYAQDGSIKLFSGDSDLRIFAGDDSSENDKPFFSIDKNGQLNARSAIIEGQIEAKEGKIANWVITGNMLLGTNFADNEDNDYYTNQFRVSLSRPTVKGGRGNSNADVFVVATKDLSGNWEWPFGISSDGSVFTSKMTAIGGNIGNFEIGQKSLINYGGDSNNRSIIALRDGTNDNDYNLSAEIVWGTIKSKIQPVLYFTSNRGNSNLMITEGWIYQPNNVTLDMGFSSPGVLKVYSNGNTASWGKINCGELWVDLANTEDNEEDYGPYYIPSTGFRLRRRYVGNVLVDVEIIY